MSSELKFSRLEISSQLSGQSSDAHTENKSSFINTSDIHASAQKISGISCLVATTQASPPLEKADEKAEFYIPLFYSEKIKNPGKSHIAKRVILGHWLFGVIAWSCISPYPLINAFSLLLLTLSYWCVYEIGYQENDDIASRCEQFPTLSSTYRQYRSQVNLYTPWPWIWSMMFAIPGCLLFSLSQRANTVNSLTEVLASFNFSAFGSILDSTSVGSDMLRFVPIWLGFLVVVRGTFWLYNRVNEVTRVWIYPLLQVQQLFGFALLASTNFIGSLLLLSLTFSRWIQYCVYRCGGERKRFPINLSCLMMFGLLFAALYLSSPEGASWLTFQATIAFAYCGLRSIKKIIEFKSNIGWVDQSFS